MFYFKCVIVNKLHEVMTNNNKDKDNNCNNINYITL